ncbi:hypothetical protein JZ751_005858 [Albula glossodonta]|uniref:CBM21 domain-containing protein n=1 Tax=Albula glossodonta TaxID=121402 RepID=A0A8T2P6M9_9TELE|nr:hypothetical protein JZ751_005858 [Albula glossodonta]
MSAASNSVVPPVPSSDSPMETAGEPRLFGASSFLEVVDCSSWDVDEDELEGRLKPKSSPLRPMAYTRSATGIGRTPATHSEGVAAAARRGSTPPGMEALEGNGRETEEYFLSSLFTVPQSPEELLTKLEEQKCDLECIELLPGTTSLRGVIRVLNLSYDKIVYVRTTLDGWATHFDLLAEFIPGSSDGETDRFMFKLTLVPPFDKEGAKVEFCLRYETPGGTYWANNNGMNYVVFCHQRAAKEAKEKQQEEVNSKIKKSCLKLTSKDFAINTSPVTICAETADTPTQKQEVVVVRKPLENPALQSDGRHGDSHPKSLVDNNQDYSWRRRRRTARLAQLRNHFYPTDAETQDEGISGKGEETSNMETMKEIQTAPHWETTSNLPGMPDRNQINGMESTPTCDRIPRTSCISDSDSALPFRPENVGGWDRANSNSRHINHHMPDTAQAPPEDRTTTVGSWESWDNFDPAASFTENFSRQLDLSDGPASEVNGETGTWEHAAPGGEEKEQMSAKRDDEQKMDEAAQSRLWTETSDVKRQSTDLYTSPMDQPKLSLDEVSKPMISELLMADTSAPTRHKEAPYSQDEDKVHSSHVLTLWGDEDVKADMVGVEGIDGVGEYAKSRSDQFTVESPELPPSPAEEVTLTEVGLESLRQEVTEGISSEESVPSEIYPRTDHSIHDMVCSSTTFTQTYRGKVENARDREGEVFRERADRDEEESMENVESLNEDEETSMEYDYELLDNEEDLSSKEIGDPNTENEEGILVGTESKEDLPEEEEMLQGSEEDVYDEEEMLMETEEDHYYEEDLLMDNDDLYGEEKMDLESKQGVEKVRDEGSMTHEDLSLVDQGISPEEQDLDDEVARILGGITNTNENNREYPEKGKDILRKEEAYLSKKEEDWHGKEVQHQEGVGEPCSEIELDVSEGGRRNGLATKERRQNSPSTDSQPDEKMDQSAPGVKTQQLKSQTSSGFDQDTSTCSGLYTPSPSVTVVRLRPMLLSSTREMTDERSDAGEDHPPQADLGPVEEPGYHATVHLPPVEKVENVARNYLSRWRDLLSRNVSRAILYALLCLIFFVTAFHYDFLACFAFYLLTVYWFCFHWEKQRLQGTDRIE